MNFSVNIIRDIDICFAALVRVNYLPFLRRLKHSGPWQGELFLPMWRHNLLLWHLRLRKGKHGTKAP
jgi:hypothetical protein